jgi:hypothetical protein
MSDQAPREKGPSIVYRAISLGFVSLDDRRGDFVLKKICSIQAAPECFHFGHNDRRRLDTAKR